VSMATRVRLIFAGWLPAGRRCSGGAFRLSRRRAWQRKPLLLIARSRVRSARCHISVRSPPGWLCLPRVPARGRVVGKSCAAERRASQGQAPWPAPVFGLAGVAEAPGSRAAAGRRAAIAQRPLRPEGRPRTLRGAGPHSRRSGAGHGQSSMTASDQHQPASSRAIATSAMTGFFFRSVSTCQR